jgi:hypothetical protein
VTNAPDTWPSAGAAERSMSEPAQAPLAVGAASKTKGLARDVLLQWCPLVQRRSSEWS